MITIQKLGVQRLYDHPVYIYRVIKNLCAPDDYYTEVRCTDIFITLYIYISIRWCKF